MWAFSGRLEFNILIWHYLNLTTLMHLKTIGKKTSFYFRLSGQFQVSLVISLN